MPAMEFASETSARYEGQKTKSNLNLAKCNDRIIMKKMIISHSYIMCSLLKGVFINITATMLGCYCLTDSKGKWYSSAS